MDDDSVGRTSMDQGAAVRPNGRRGAGVLFAMLPAATFLIGLLIGVAIWGGDGARDRDDITAPSSTEAGGSVGRGPAPSDRTVTATVPDECLAAVAESRRLLDLVDQVRTAIGDLDLTRLQQIVDELESSSQEARVLGEVCQAQVDVSVASPS